MRFEATMRMVDETKNTIKFQLVGESPPMTSFYVNRARLASMPFDTREMILEISSEPFADGEVALAFPPVPFSGVLRRFVRYQHTIKRAGTEKQAPNTPELPVTLAYVEKAVLERKFVVDRLPIYFGVSPINEVSTTDEERAVVVVTDGEIDRADAVDAFDAFIRESVQVKRGGQLTTRQVWTVWAARCGADPEGKEIAGVPYTIVYRRLRDVLGVAAAPKPTRIDGIIQRYWPGYSI